MSYAQYSLPLSMQTKKHTRSSGGVRSQNVIFVKCEGLVEPAFKRGGIRI